MNLKFYPKYSLPKHLCRDGARLIQKRFKEEWGITRTDASEKSVYERDNFVLFEEERLVGWLGLESSLEFTNACIEREHIGGALLRVMIAEALQLVPDRKYFAYVPISRPASAKAFLSNGFQFVAASGLTIKSYPERDIELVYLERNTEVTIELDNATVLKELRQIRYFRDGYANNADRQVY